MNLKNEMYNSICYSFVITARSSRIVLKSFKQITHNFFEHSQNWLSISKSNLNFVHVSWFFNI